MNKRRVFWGGAAAAVLSTVLFLLATGSAGAATCDPSRYTVNGQFDVASYLQCAAPSSSPNTIAPGGVVTLSVGGFGSNTGVNIELHSTPVPLGTATADNFGNVNTAVTIPSNVSGAHEIWVIGVDQTGAPFTAVLPITIVADGTAPTATNSGTGALPTTGSSTRQAVGIGLGLIIFGGVIVWGVRREHADEVAA